MTRLGNLGLQAGDTFEVEYPFVRCLYTEYDNDGPCDMASWKPGARYEECCDDVEAVADGIGKQVLTVVGTFQPPRFPGRVAFTVKWIDPNGNTFGKNRLHITIVDVFRRRVRGYRDHFSVRDIGIEEMRKRERQP